MAAKISSMTMITLKRIVIKSLLFIFNIYYLNSRTLFVAKERVPVDQKKLWHYNWYSFQWGSHIRSKTLIRISPDMVRVEIRPNPKISPAKINISSYVFWKKYLYKTLFYFPENRVIGELEILYGSNEKLTL